MPVEGATAIGVLDNHRLTVSAYLTCQEDLPPSAGVYLIAMVGCEINTLVDPPPAGTEVRADGSDHGPRIRRSQGNAANRRCSTRDHERLPNQNQVGCKAIGLFDHVNAYTVGLGYAKEILLGPDTVNRCLTRDCSAARGGCHRHGTAALRGVSGRQRRSCLAITCDLLGRLARRQDPTLCGQVDPSGLLRDASPPSPYTCTQDKAEGKYPCHNAPDQRRLQLLSTPMHL